MVFNFSNSPHQPGWRQHVCGLYYYLPHQGFSQKTYLPPVELQAHATILDTTSRTVLRQTFVNPSTEKGIRQVRYTFPLYDGVSVVGFTCHVGSRTITGEVKEKEKAKAVFQEAVARGETAGLLEQLPNAADVFTTTVGNILPGAKVVIQITYLGELKHDMEVDGIRFTIPNVLCPRYGAYPGTLQTTSAVDAMGGSIVITVDAEMADGSFIQKLQSPSHPISMTMGTTSSAPDSDPVMTKASATLSLGSAQLDTDFVLQVVAKNNGAPKAVLENHPSVPNHRALMTTLVPRFSLPPEKPEIVFVCDRSGSMMGSRITLVIQALKVFLKSLPVGVKFNICSFGSSHSFLWPKSVTYDQSTLDQAIRHTDTISANYGGTEMLEPLKATLERRYKDMPLDVMVLTDGEIWNQDVLFEYLNRSVKESKAPTRLFTLGIGNGVSHALIEGIARAGDGFSQTVGEGEKMDTKVVRMLKGALSPHISDYTLEVKYSGKVSTADENDDFEIIEKVTDSLKVHLHLGDEREEIKKPISLFDTSVDPDKEDPKIEDETGEGRYAHLPKIDVPKIIQAPQNIPSLFAFNRTTAYLLLGPEAPQGTPQSVVLRGTSAHGPLELEIPIQILDTPSETIHQLAARKAISELEQGRGWLPEARDDSDTLVKSKFEGRFDDMVEREAVRLGVQFQVGGKWCSFVAVESNNTSREEQKKESEGWEWLDDECASPDQSAGQTQTRKRSLPPTMSSASTHYARMGGLSQTTGGGPNVPSHAPSLFSSPPAPSPAPSNMTLQEYQTSLMTLNQENKSRLHMQRSSQFGAPTVFRLGSAAAQSGAAPFGQSNSPLGAPSASGGLFGSAAPATASGQLFGHSKPGLFSSGPGSLFSSTAPAAAPSPAAMSFGGSPQAPGQQLGQSNSPMGAPSASGGLFGSAAPATASGQQLGQSNSPLGAPSASGGLFGSAATATASGQLFGHSKSGLFSSGPGSLFSSTAPAAAPSPAAEKTPEELVHHLIGLQTFEGSWEATTSLLSSLKISEAAIVAETTKAGMDKNVYVTALVVAVLEHKLRAFQGSWDLVVDKARGWLADQGVSDVDGLVSKAKVLLN